MSAGKSHSGRANHGSKVQGPDKALEAEEGQPQGDSAEADTLAAAQQTAGSAAEDSKVKEAGSAQDASSLRIEQLQQQLTERDAMLLEKDSQVKADAC